MRIAAGSLTILGQHSANLSTYELTGHTRNLTASFLHLPDPTADDYNFTVLQYFLSYLQS